MLININDININDRIVGRYFFYIYWISQFFDDM